MSSAQFGDAGQEKLRTLVAGVEHLLTLLPTTEARVLASHMGQIVMVVAADSTKQNTVNLALETIERCEVVLMLLNKADKTDVGSYYGYYGHDATR